MSDFDISVIVPYYNTNEELFLKCLVSVAVETRLSIELLLIDDGSDKNHFLNSQLIIHRVLNHHAKNLTVRKIVLNHEGVAAARNCGIEHVQGKYLYFLDSDDILLPNALFLLYKRMEQTGAGFAMGNYQYQYGFRIVDAEPQFKNEIISPIDAIHKTCICGNKLFRRDIIMDYNIRYPNLKVGEDLCFYHRYLVALEQCNQKIVCLKENLYLYRMIEGSSSKTYNLKVLDFMESFRLIESLYESIPDFKKEFVYDEMFYLKNCMEKLPRYRNCNERKLIFKLFKEEALARDYGSKEAIKIRNEILKMPEYFYCGMIPSILYRMARKVKNKMWRIFE